MTDTILNIKARFSSEAALREFFEICSQIPPDRDKVESFCREKKFTKIQKDRFVDAMECVTDFSALESGFDIGLLGSGSMDDIYIAKILFKVGADHQLVDVDWGGEERRRYALIGGKKASLDEYLAAIRLLDPDAAMGIAIELMDLGVFNDLLEQGASPSTVFLGQSILQIACLQSEMSNAPPRVISDLIRAGADLNFTSNRNGTPAITLCIKRLFGFHGYARLIDVVEEMLEHGADPNLPDPDGVTPAMWAVEKGYLDVFKLLIDRGADINATDNNGRNCLFYAFSRSWKNQCHDVVGFLIENGVDVNCLDFQGNSALIEASLCRDSESILIKMGLSHKSLNIDYSGDVDQDLMLAIRYNQIDKVSSLISGGVNVNSDKSYPEGISDALKCSLVHGRLDCLDLLCAAGVSLQVGGRSDLAVEIAARHGHVDVISYLIKKGLSLLPEPPNHLGPLWHAVKSGRDECAAFLIKNGACKCVSPGILIVAVSHCSCATISSLFSHFGSAGWQGGKAVREAIQRGNEEVLSLVIGLGAEIPEDAMSWAVSKKVRERLDGSTGCMAVLIERGANIEGLSSSGITPLIEAVRGLENESFDFLVSNGCDVNHPDETGRTPISHAVGKNYERAVEVLLLNGADVHAKDGRGFNAISYLKRDGWGNIRKMIMDYADAI